MTGTVPVFWQVDPLSPPQVQRYCTACRTPRPFRSSGKVRLNANGRRLDAWLIYKCTSCDRTWNLPLLDRVPVADVPTADLVAMQASDPGWVHARAFDLAALRRHASQVLLPRDVTVTRRLPSSLTASWSQLVLTIKAPWPVGYRLDQLLAQELGLSRSSIQKLQGSGGLHVAKGPSHALKALLVGTVILQFDTKHIAENACLDLARSFGLPPSGRGP